MGVMQSDDGDWAIMLSHAMSKEVKEEAKTGSDATQRELHQQFRGWPLPYRKPEDGHGRTR